MAQNAGIIRLGNTWIAPDGRRFPVLSGADGEPDPNAPAGDAGDRVQEILDQLADEATVLSPEQLAEMEAELAASFRALNDTGTDEALAEARGVFAAIVKVREALGEAEAERARTAEAFAEMAAELELDGAPAVDADEDPADVPTPDPAPVAEDETADPAKVPALVAAVAPPVVPLPRRTVPAVARRETIRRIKVGGRASLVASGVTHSTTALDRNSTFEALAEAAKSLGRGTEGVQTKVPVVRFEWDYDDDQSILNTRSGEGNAQVIERALGFPNITRAYEQAGGDRHAITAAICGPFATDLEMPVIGNNDQPVRDMLPTFGADRGGLRWTPSPLLTDVPANAWGVWTTADDIEDPFVTKVCATIDCRDEVEAEIEAVYRCIELTNFMYRFSRDQIDATMALIDTAFARFFETARLVKIAAGSTAVTSAVEFGAARDVMRALLVSVARMRRRHRIPQGVPMVWAYPDWLHDMIRADLVAQMPTGGDLGANFSIADATIMGWFRAANVQPEPFIDGENAAQTMAEAQAGGVLLDWPLTVISYLYPQGTWLRLDGGRMDLGVVRDGTLNRANKLQIFAEDFENVVKRGALQSLKWTATLCPNGSASGLIAPPACA